MKKFLSLIFITFLSVILSFAVNIDELKKSAEQGVVAAQYNLGICYYNGDGVKKDLTEAVKWYRKAADQGDFIAQYNLGICYDNGDGVKKDLTEAFKWYRKAAEQGYSKAQHNLGICYYNGDGVIQNNIKALAWVSTAFANGDNGATKAMRVIKQKMTSAQIEQALKLADNYTKGIFD